MQKSYKFEDVAIVQKKNICDSRANVKTESEIVRGILRPIPIIAANMSTVTNAGFCQQLYDLGALGILHRAFAHENNYLAEAKCLAMNCPVVPTSIGLEDHQLLAKLIKVGANLITIDVAHAYCDRTIEMCRHIRKFYPHVKVIVGNTINVKMLDETVDLVDALKLGCGNGSACETATTAGCYEPQFSVVAKFKERAQQLGLPIISDGSIRVPSDFVKAIGAGASAVMAGQIFARCPESAAKTIEVGGIKKRVYVGMASRQSQEGWRGKVSNDCPEGKTTLLDIGEPVEQLLARYLGALRSGISYGGCDNVDDFRQSCEFILV